MTTWPLILKSVSILCTNYEIRAIQWNTSDLSKTKIPMFKKFSIAVLCSVLLWSCGGKESAELIIYNATVYTVDEDFKIFPGTPATYSYACKPHWHIFVRLHATVTHVHTPASHTDTYSYTYMPHWHLIHTPTRHTDTYVDTRTKHWHLFMRLNIELFHFIKLTSLYSIQNSWAAAAFPNS